MNATWQIDSHTLGRWRGKEGTLNDLTLMELAAAALFTHDARGRIVTSNEPDPERAPRLFLGRTREGLVRRFRDDLPEEIVASIDRLLATEPSLGDPRSRPATFDALCDVLAAESPVSQVWEGPIWHFPETIPAPSDVVIIGPENAKVLMEHFPYSAEHWPELWPCCAVVEDGVAVAHGFSSRLTPDAAAAGVNTVEAFRGRGYAPRVVAAWALAVRESGRVPLYSTSWDNLASQAVARKLGLVLYGAELSMF